MFVLQKFGVDLKKIGVGIKIRAYGQYFSIFHLFVVVIVYFSFLMEL
jgi:hypothetical protein